MQNLRLKSYLKFKILISLLLFFYIPLVANTDIESKNHRINANINLVLAMSETIHSLQQERGASCGYISSDGKKFSLKLKTIIKNSNIKIEILTRLLQKNHLKFEEYETLENTLLELYKIRKKVKNLEINFSKTFSKYTQSISFMLMSISTISDTIKNKELSNKLYSYSLLLMHKESIGQKRAALSALFSRDDFSSEIFEYYLTADTQEKIYLKIFLRVSNEDIKQSYLLNLKDDAVGKVQHYEELALKKLSGKKIDADPVQWFEVVTKKIGLVSNIEKLLFKDIIKLIAKISHNTSIELTTQEKEWIATHIVKVGVEQWTPVVFSNTGDDIDGIAGDFTKLIVKKTGLRIEIVNDTWDQLLKDFKNKEIDLLPATYRTDERATFGLYSKGYFKMKDAIYVRESNTNIKSLEDLAGQTLAIPKGYGTIEKLRKKFPNIKLVFTDDLDDSINRLLNGRVTAFYEGHIAADAKISGELIKGLKAIPVKAYKAPYLYYFSKMQEPILKNIIDKALQSITYTQRNDIISRWTNGERSIELSQSEQKIIDEGIVVKYVYDPDWAPFEWIDDIDTHQGILSDILRLIEEKSGITLEPVASYTWTEAIQKVKLKEATMFSGIGETKKRLEYLDFTKKPMFRTPYVVVVKKNSNFMDGIQSLSNKKVEVALDSTIQALLKEYKPNLKFQTARTIELGLHNVQNGDADAFIISGTTAKYYINALGFSDLKIVKKSQINLDLYLDLKIAVLKDMPPEVLSILNKSIDVISEQEIEDIVYKWTQRKIKSEINWILIAQIGSVVFLIFLFILYNNRKLKRKVEEKTSEITSLLSGFDKNVIASTTDKNGIITYVSEAFCKISGYTRIELIGQSQNIVRHPDMSSEIFKDLWETIQNDDIWHGEVKNKRKDGTYYWVSVIITPECNSAGSQCGYSAIRQDITAAKEVEDLTKNLENKIEVQTKDLKKQLRIVKVSEKKQEELIEKVKTQQQFTQTLLDSQEQLIVTTDGKALKSANETFFDFFAIDSIEEFSKLYDTDCICGTFNTKAPNGYLQKNMGRESWIEYVISRSFDMTHKVMISMNDSDFIFSVTAAKLPGIEGIKSAVFTNISEMEKAKQEIVDIHKHTRESIEYAALIQGALIPDNQIFRKYFKDYFAIWHPKDIVGGDIYLMHEINENELIIMVIDCTGHGVPGAFVTMLVKAIERQLMANIHKDVTVSPAKILSIFNRSLKNILKQENIDSISNAGFDGGIIYYNKKEKIVKFSGAETPLFYIDENNDFKTIKGSRHSIGYKKSDVNFEFTEHTIEVKEGMKFYCTTDGYLDQNGGDKSFPFGKKRFAALINEYKEETMADQQEVLLNTLGEYQDEEDRNDDVTVIAFEIKEHDIHQTILEYNGVLTQGIIAHSMDVIENSIDNIGMVGKVSTLVVELMQNMMHYSKSHDLNCRDIRPAGFIEVTKDSEEIYYAISKNVISIEDKIKMQKALEEVKSLDEAGIKKKYRELRKSGQQSHEKGGGIGFYEIAKLIQSFDYSFESINEEKYLYEFKAVITSRKKV